MGKQEEQWGIKIKEEPSGGIYRMVLKYQVEGPAHACIGNREKWNSQWPRLGEIRIDGWNYGALMGLARGRVVPRCRLSDTGAFQTDVQSCSTVGDIEANT
jgi:hypothetical protein